ncbi:MAG: acyl-CoA dehydrogenase, partial [Novosphingobium sp.]
SEDFGLAEAWAHQRTLRIADGPDEVHARAVARIEFARHAPMPGNDGAFSSADVGVSR